MKLKKIKNYIFAFILTIIGMFVVSNSKIEAVNFNNSVITYNENIPLINEDMGYVVINNVNNDFIVNGYYYSINATVTIKNCVLSVDTNYSVLTCQIMYLNDLSNGTFNNLPIEQEIYIYGDYIELDGESFYPLPTGASEEDLEDAFNDGYNDGVVFGSNNGLVIESCTFDNLVNGPCNSQYYSLTSGSINFDGLNEYVYDLGGNDYSITFTFTDSISADSLLYTRFKETEGSSISFYNGNILLETLYNSDFASWQSDYYKTYRLSDFGQITSSFNKIIINNISYDYSISEFGVLQDISYNLGNENGVIEGYQSGFTNGNIVGYNRGFKEGTENGNNLVNMVGAIFTGPVTMFQQIFNFNVLGINFASMLLGLVTLLVVIWLIKKFI